MRNVALTRTLFFAGRYPRSFSAVKLLFPERSLRIICALITIFVLTGCIEKETLVRIPDAENILFTSTGDLLVSGGKNIYQIRRSTDALGNTSYQRRALYEGSDCAFAGIAEHNGWVFTVCQENRLEWRWFRLVLVQDTHLLAASLKQRPLIFRALDRKGTTDPLDSLSIPNGLAFAPDGNLIIADTNYFGRSALGRISLDYSASPPAIKSFEKNWLGDAYGIQSPNGVRVSGNTLYVSDGNKVRRFIFNAQGEIPLTLTDYAGNSISNAAADNVLFSGATLIDDIMPYCGGIAVAMYLQGQLVYQSAAGDRIATAPLSFESPSSLAIGAGEGFNGYDLLVTEKGLIFDQLSALGNRLSRVPLAMDLANAETCRAITAP